MPPFLVSIVKRGNNSGKENKKETISKTASY